jgi:hypothetical protein
VLAAVAGAGCANDTTGTTVMPSVSLVTPESAFLARTHDIIISGYATHWNDMTTVDFGPGVMINSVNAPSPTALLVNVTVAADAPIGTRDVTVTEGTTKETYIGAFKLESPIEVTVQGTLAQGSIATLKIRNLDLETPFDTTSMSDFFSTTFTNLKITSPTGTTITVNDATAFEIDAQMLIDVMTPAQASDLTVQSGPPPGFATAQYPAPGALNIAARSAMAITPGMRQNGNVMNAFETQLYSMATASGVQIVDAQVTASDPMGVATPVLVALPQSGHFQDAIFISDSGTFIGSMNPTYIIYYDSSGTQAYEYTIQSRATTATAIEEKEPNDDIAHATMVPSLPMVAQGASLSLNSDDFYQIEIAAGDVGKSVQIITLPGDPQTDTVVEVQTPDGMTFGMQSDDQGYHENFTSDPIPMAGTYYVRVSPSTVFDPAHTRYDLIIRLVQ